jgi:hypothetical protein
MDDDMVFGVSATLYILVAGAAIVARVKCKPKDVDALQNRTFFVPEKPPKSLQIHGVTVDHAIGAPILN